MASTEKNAVSSRSHAILILKLVLRENYRRIYADEKMNEEEEMNDVVMDNDEEAEKQDEERKKDYDHYQELKDIEDIINRDFGGDCKDNGDGSDDNDVLVFPLESKYQLPPPVSYMSKLNLIDLAGSGSFVVFLSLLFICGCGCWFDYVFYFFFFVDN
jgi:hypothetical protein